ncbi:hypothetical protein E5288_WYG010625 [Bos mutus]|uniref:Uncharacterized protein n=1 Tax=Bos mutus TaxID=72004 RepID=A0A6B0RUH4_9CETA|nr:hypothetical protein [Bos mutus]
MERVTCKVHLQHLRMATPPELLSWLVSLLVKAVTAWGAVTEMRGIAQVAEDFSTLKMLFHPAFYLISMGKNQVRLLWYLFYDGFQKPKI